MADSEYEEGVLSILRGRKGWDEEFSSISEFKPELEEGDLAQEKLEDGWVWWRENESQRQQQILTLLQNIASGDCSLGHYLVQFWAVVKVKNGRHHYLSSSNYPFCVGPDLRKGHCWYRKLCMNLVYVVDVDGDQEQVGLGGVGRAYRTKHPESSPDLRLYSTDEFPMRDEAARCGFRGYMALPLFHFHTNECYAVLELLSDDTTIGRRTISALDTALGGGDSTQADYAVDWIAELRSTHNPIVSSGSPKQMLQQLDSEIREILESAMVTVPRLYLTQVWVPCHHCIINTNLCYMQIASLTRSEIDDDDDDYYDDDFDDETFCYRKACELHNLQIDLSNSFNSNLCDVSMSISKNPLAHYAQRARINKSHSFAVSLQSLHNSNRLYVIQFFLLQPKFREDHACALLLRIMKMNLKTFKFESGGRLVSESQMTNAISCESIHSLEVINSYKQLLSESDFTTVHSCCLRPSPEESRQGWVFGINSNSLLVPAVVIKEKIQNFMKKIELDCTGEYWIIQFWAPKMVEDRCCLEALDQPYAVSCLAKGLASFRKKCITHSYFVDQEAKDEELGPPGRVFRNGHPEITPDLALYSTNEFPIRNYAIHCCCILFNPGYLALPIFEDEHNHKCIGVLEFVGFFHPHFEYIRKALKKAELCSTHTGLYPRFLEDDQNSRVIIYGREEALTEVHNALVLICKIPQLYMAKVWIHDGECVTSINSNTSCMELALSRSHLGIHRPAGEVQRIHVQSKKGMIGMVLASENKSCFCRNLCEFSIVDQPLSHYETSERREVCFAICLQSSHTGNLVYVMEFFLYQGSATYEYVRSFLNILLPIMKHELKSFKMASGKQLGEELVVEVIEFSDAHELDSSESEQTDVFPIKFKSVQYNQEEHQHSEEQQTEECSVVVEHQDSEEQQAEECSVDAHIEEQQAEGCSVDVEYHHSEEQQREEECSAAAAAASDSKRRKRGKRKTQECSAAAAASNSKTKERRKPKKRVHLNLSLEDLKSHFGKMQKDAAEALGVSRSTLKRACRRYKIGWWPGDKINEKNPVRFFCEREIARDSQLPSTCNLQPLDTNTESTPRVTVEEDEDEDEEEEEAEKVVIKVKHEEDIFKFDLCRPLGLAKLIEEVATRINLEKDAFKLKYLDEDGDEISLTIDADLQYCCKTQITLMHKTFIQLFVRR